MKLTESLIAKCPKVLLHEHLDGGLRPHTILELAKDQKVTLPENSADALASWFHRGANRRSLPLYLECFAVTIAVMQTKESLARVAYEALLDAAAENIVYIEIRFHPGFHTQKGLTLEEVMEAVRTGCEKGKKETGVEYGILVCGMRNMDPAISLEMAELAVAYRDRGVVGFDIAGEEHGHPAKRYIEAFQYIKRENFHITIHAGEAFGKDSIWQAIQWCGAHRIGHATRLIEDMVVKDGEVLQMGTLSQYILDNRIPLEICLLSNIQTGAAESLEKHPFPIYHRYKFRVTVNTDNRLMSNTTMTKEFWTMAQTYGISLEDIERLTCNAMKSAFIPYKKRVRLIYDKIKSGYAKIREELE